MVIRAGRRVVECAVRAGRAGTLAWTQSVCGRQQQQLSCHMWTCQHQAAPGSGGGEQGTPP